MLGFMTWFSLSLFFDQTTVKLQRPVMKNYTGKRLRQQCFLCFMTQQKKFSNPASSCAQLGKFRRLHLNKLHSFAKDVQLISRDREVTAAAAVLNQRKFQKFVQGYALCMSVIINFTYFTRLSTVQ